MSPVTAVADRIHTPPPEYRCSICALPCLGLACSRHPQAVAVASTTPRSIAYRWAVRHRLALVATLLLPALALLLLVSV